MRSFASVYFHALAKPCLLEDCLDFLEVKVGHSSQTHLGAPAFDRRLHRNRLAVFCNYLCLPYVARRSLAHLGEFVLEKVKYFSERQAARADLVAPVTDRTPENVECVLGFEDFILQAQQRIEHQLPGIVKLVSIIRHGALGCAPVALVAELERPFDIYVEDVAPEIGVDAHYSSPPSLATLSCTLCGIRLDA